MPGADTGALARNNLSKRGKVAAERIGILVVDFSYVLLAEETGSRSAFLVLHKCGRVGNGSAGNARDEINNVDI